MSKKRGRTNGPRRQSNHHQPSSKPGDHTKPAAGGIKASVRTPLSQAALTSFASVVLAGGAAAQQTNAPLPSIDVVGAQGGYQATSSSLSRFPVPLRDTAQTVNVVPQQVIREQNAATMQEALRNVPGITFRAGEGGNQGDTPFIRGFDARNDIFRDGVRDPGWYTRDLFTAQQVEVYKGPSSFLFGRGSTGGAINIVTKTAQDRNFVDAEVIGTTESGARGSIDANGRFNDRWAGRIQAMGQNYPTPGRDHVEEKRWGVAPSIVGKLTEQTKLTLSYIYQHDNNIPDRGIPYLPATWGTPRVPSPVDRANFYGILGGNLADSEVVNTSIATAKIEHEFAPDLKVSNITRWVEVDRFNRATLPNNFTPPVGGLATYIYRPGRQQLTVDNSLLANQTDVSAKFTTGPVQHTAVAGLDFAEENRQQISFPYTANSAGTTSFLFPSPYRAPGTFGPPGTPTKVTGRTIAVYAADQAKITEWFELLGGVRYDNYESTATSPTPLSRTDNMFSWRVGGVFHPTQWSSVYIMHGTSFNPSAEFLTLAAANSNLDPEKNETTEAGVKADVLGGRLSLTGAVFRTEKTNMRVPDPTNTAVNILAGLSRVEGFEVGAVGKLTDQWQIYAGYTHLRSKIVETTTLAQLGKELLNTPNNAFSLWTTYDITPQWTVGFGAYYLDEVWADANNTALVPDYWRFDAMVSYKVTQYATLQFNIYNITNETYFAQTYNNWAVPGPGRYATLTFRVNFDPVSATAPPKMASNIYKK